MSRLVTVQGAHRGNLAAVAACAALSLWAVAPASAAPRVAGPDLPFASASSLERETNSRPIGEAKLERKLRKLSRKAPGASGFYVYDLGSRVKPVLFDRNQGERRKLASNQKLFTTSTALDVLGPEGRIETRVKIDGKLGDSGRLKGDVYLVGGGDPSLGSDGMNDLAADVRRAGVRKVSGTVFGDDSIFDRLRGVPDSNYGPSEFIAPLSGLVFGGSTYAEDPAVAAAKVFRDELRDEGIKVDGKVKVGTVPQELRSEPEIGAYDSPTIAALAAATNKPSDNFYAEMLLKRLAAGSDRQGTTRGGAAAVERYAKSVGSKVDARDGSGLTKTNRSSPRDVVSLLTGVTRDEAVGKALFRSLAVAGKEGTLDDRMEGTAAAGSCRGKTGTISGVSNLSGYCRSGGELVAFSILMNGVSDFDAARAIQDEMVVQIAKYRR